MRTLVSEQTAIHKGGHAKSEKRKADFWRRGAESNRRIEVLQTSALPLGYRAPGGPDAKPPRRARAGILERETGFEPATSTLARSHSTTELLPLGELDYNET
jgi:hypothetical protein